MLILLLSFSLCLFILIINLQKQTNDNGVDISSLQAFIKKYGGNTLTHLFFLQDKQIFSAQDHSVIISYRKIGNKYIVLGDPVGNQSRVMEGINEFLSYTETNRAIPVFYQTSDLFMGHFQNHGFKSFKVGEEAKLSLDSFTIEGKKSAKFRTTLNKFSREGYTFSVIYPPFNRKLLTELKAVSDEWLSGRKEKSFSVSSFQEDYLSLFPVSILRDREGKLLAFASLPSDYQHNQTVSIDLMRYTNDSPSGSMDMIFISTILWAKERGFTSCSFGMAPLSNVGVDKHSSINEKVARFAFLYGCKFYNFKGLRSYKAKFSSEWKPRYIVYKRSSLFIVILQLMLIIRRHPEQKMSLLRRFISDKKAA